MHKIRLNTGRRIFLCGLPMSGKSTIGKALSERLGLPFVDTDRLIEDMDGNGLSCREIFKQKGEAYFRLMEQKVLEMPIKGVIALGGGAIVKSPSTIYLKAMPETLWKRFKSVPPYLEQKDPEASFYALAKRRIPLYEAAANIIVVIDHLTIDESIEKVWEAIPSEPSLESQRGENLTARP